MSSQLSALRDADQFRELVLPRGIPLSSNDYLSLARHPRLREGILRSVMGDDRVASTGSRLLSGHHQRWEGLESQFAAFVGAEASLFFPSGYSANIGLLSSILNPEDTVFSDASNHASLIDGIRLSRAKKVIFPHLDLEFLEHALKREVGGGEKIIVIESIFSMEGDRAPLRELQALCAQFNAFLVVDEAHATGVEGRDGRGLVHKSGRSGRVLATVHPCGKAMASMGAFVAGAFVLRDFLINQARSFIFTTALPPYCAAHVGAALEIVQEADAERAHLRQLSDYLRRRLSGSGLDLGRSDTQIIPVILGSNEAALRFSSTLNHAGFAVRAIRPPTVPPGSARLRLSLNAGLSISDIDGLSDALIQCHSDNAAHI